MPSVNPAPLATDASSRAPAAPTVAQALQQARVLGLERMDAQVLLGHLLQRDLAWLICHDTDALQPTQAATWSDWIVRRAAGCPVAYLTGHHEFHGLDLEVSPAVLDPRPDTETLVDWLLDLLPPDRPARVLDLGTGSGAIALAIKHRRPLAEVTAVDLSPTALAQAQRNGERLGLQVDWRQGHWLEPVAGERFDFIVSNPPYIADDDPHLPALRFEPLSALTSGPDGLRDLRELIAAAPSHLKVGGWLLLEHGYDQALAVVRLLRPRRWHIPQHRLDLAGHVRCTGAQVST